MSLKMLCRTGERRRRASRYKKVTKHYTNFIPTGKTYQIIMYDRFGKPLQMQYKYVLCD
jgi:hypothetical protein